MQSQKTEAPKQHRFFKSTIVRNRDAFESVRFLKPANHSHLKNNNPFQEAEQFPGTDVPTPKFKQIASSLRTSNDSATPVAPRTRLHSRTTLSANNNQQFASPKGDILSRLRQQSSGHSGFLRTTLGARNENSEQLCNESNTHEPSLQNNSNIFLTAPKSKRADIYNIEVQNEDISTENRPDYEDMWQKQIPRLTTAYLDPSLFLSIPIDMIRNAYNPEWYTTSPLMVTTAQYPEAAKGLISSSFNQDARQDMGYADGIYWLHTNKKLVFWTYTTMQEVVYQGSSAWSEFRERDLESEPQSVKQKARNMTVNQVYELEMDDYITCINYGKVKGISNKQPTTSVLVICLTKRVKFYTWNEAKAPTPIDIEIAVSDKDLIEKIAFAGERIYYVGVQGHLKLLCDFSLKPKWINFSLDFVTEPIKKLLSLPTYVNRVILNNCRAYVLTERFYPDSWAMKKLLNVVGKTNIKDNVKKEHVIIQYSLMSEGKSQIRAVNQLRQSELIDVLRRSYENAFRKATEEDLKIKDIFLETSPLKSQLGVVLGNGLFMILQSIKPINISKIKLPRPIPETTSLLCGIHRIVSEPAPALSRHQQQLRRQQQMRSESNFLQPSSMPLPERETSAKIDSWDLSVQQELNRSKEEFQRRQRQQLDQASRNTEASLPKLPTNTLFSLGADDITTYQSYFISNDPYSCDLYTRSGSNPSAYIFRDYPNTGEVRDWFVNDSLFGPAKEWIHMGEKTIQHIQSHSLLHKILVMLHMHHEKKLYLHESERTCLRTTRQSRLRAEDDEFSIESHMHNFKVFEELAKVYGPIAICCNLIEIWCNPYVTVNLDPQTYKITFSTYFKIPYPPQTIPGTITSSPEIRELARKVMKSFDFNSAPQPLNPVNLRGVPLQLDTSQPIIYYAILHYFQMHFNIIKDQPPLFFFDNKKLSYSVKNKFAAFAKFLVSKHKEISTINPNLTVKTAPIPSLSEYVPHKAPSPAEQVLFGVTKIRRQQAPIETRAIDRNLKESCLLLTTLDLIQQLHTALPQIDLLIQIMQRLCILPSPQETGRFNRVSNNPTIQKFLTNEYFRTEMREIFLELYADCNSQIQSRICNTLPFLMNQNDVAYKRFINGKLKIGDLGPYIEGLVPSRMRIIKKFAVPKNTNNAEEEFKYFGLLLAVNRHNEWRLTINKNAQDREPNQISTCDMNIKILEQYRSEYTNLALDIIQEAIVDTRRVKTPACVARLKRLIEELKRDGNRFLIEKVAELLMENEMQSLRVLLLSKEKV